MYEIGYFLIVTGIFLFISIFKGRQAVMNIIFGLYLSLLITLVFPNYETLFSGLANPQTIAAAKLGFFAFITLCMTLLCYRVMPSEFRENRLESLWKKILLALGATILVMIFSFQILPVSEYLSLGSQTSTLFSQEIYFFWWLLVPFVILYIV